MSAPADYPKLAWVAIQRESPASKATWQTRVWSASNVAKQKKTDRSQLL